MPVSALQEFLQKRGEPIPVYTETIGGPPFTGFGDLIKLEPFLSFSRWIFKLKWSKLKEKNLNY